MLPENSKVPSVFHVVIVAAGKGERVGGGVPKQYRLLAGEAVLKHAVDVFHQHPNVGSIVVAIGADQTEMCRAALSETASQVILVHGGLTRRESVLAGLNRLSETVPAEAIVLVHDGARPFVSPEQVDRVVSAVNERGAALPGYAVVDTLKRANTDDMIAETVTRDGLYHAQTPQGFRLGPLLDAHRQVDETVLATDDAALFERMGWPVSIVPGDRNNIKLTTEADFRAAEERMRPLEEVRTGMGFDVHRFVAGDGVWLCGVHIPYDRQLDGHSDADVGLHAITDALLGAVADGDIGAHFPPSDQQWKGVASDVFLRHAGGIVTQKRGRIVNIDATLICEAPKVGPHRDVMRARIAEILNLDIGRVSIKATTTERLGFAGRGEGIACQAVAAVALPVSAAP